MNNSPEPIHIISLGAGVQSSTMSLMAAAGEITPMPTAAIFADTQAEPVAVYQWLSFLAKNLPFPIYKVTKGNLTASALRVRISGKSGNGYQKPNLPIFIKGPDGKVYMMARHCTRDFKIVPIQSKIRELRKSAGLVPVVCWIGISTDEISRCKDSRIDYITNRHPLIDAGMSRGDCLKWMAAKGFPTPPRSACIYCPFHNDAEWQRLRTKDPGSFDGAVGFEKNLQAIWPRLTALNPGGTPFLHRSCKPLSEVDFSTEEERGQLNMFNNECEGMCGV